MGILLGWRAANDGGGLRVRRNGAGGGGGGRQGSATAPLAVQSARNSRNI
jgi:hypothetical protein